MISNATDKSEYSSGDYDLSTLDVRNIDETQLRRKEHVLKWAIIGAATGLIVCGTLGY